MESIKSKDLKGKVKCLKTTFHRLGFELNEATKEPSEYELFEKFNQQGDLVERSFNSFLLGHNRMGFGGVRWVEEPPRSEYKKWNYTYDDKNRRLEESQENLMGELRYKRIFKYFDSLQKSEKLLLNNKNLIKDKEITSYNKEGLIVESILLDASEKFQYKKTYQYNKQEKTLVTYYSQNKEVLGVKDSITLFNKKNQEIEYDYLLPNGKTKNRYTYEYDEVGNKITDKHFTASGKLSTTTRYKYEYDKYNNWVKKTNISSKKEGHVYERTILYY